VKLNICGEYPPDWSEISLSVKEAADHRCVRCHHRFHTQMVGGIPALCDSLCDPTRGLHVKRGLVTVHHPGRLDGINYGVHHFDGDKSNCRWWNLMALCNSCHLTIQALVIPERPWLFEHSEWMRPYAAGYYAFAFGGLEVSRAEVERDIERFIAMGQPWLAEAV